MQHTACHNREPAAERARTPLLNGRAVARCGRTRAAVGAPRHAGCAPRCRRPDSCLDRPRARRRRGIAVPVRVAIFGPSARLLQL